MSYFKKRAKIKAPEISFTYQREKIKIKIPPQNFGEIISRLPITSKFSEEIISERIKKFTKRFRDFIKKSKEVLFIVNDATRPTPTPQILKLLQPYFWNKKLKFLVATGIHTPPSQEEFKAIFGEYYSELKEKIYSHNGSDKKEMVKVGLTRRGTPVAFNRLFIKADRVVIISSVEPHYFAGWTGGFKSLLPGIASQEAIVQNHKLALLPEAELLRLRGNPVQEDICEAASLAGDKPLFGIQVVSGFENQIQTLEMGEVKSAFLKALRVAQKAMTVMIKEKAEILVAKVEEPFNINLYQALKGVENGKRALKKGGILILIAECTQGFGESKYYQLLTECSSLKEILTRVHQAYQIGYHKAYKLAQFLSEHQLWVVSELEDKSLEKGFIKPYHSVEEALEDALRIKGSKAKISFLPEAATTVPII